jgi:hypothetical protein
VLLGKTWVSHSDTYREEVKSDLPLGIVDEFTPTFFVAVGTIDNEEDAVGSGKRNMGSGMWEAVVFFEAPEDISGGAPMTGTMRGEHFGI